MRTVPEDLTDAAVADAVAAHWALTPIAIEHAPVGFGSHHWELTAADGGRRFVTADRVGDDDHRLTALVAALHIAYGLRHRCGLDFVIAPMPGVDHQLLARTDDYVIALYPFQQKVGTGVCDDDQLLSMITALHQISPALIGVTEEDDLEIVDRPVLESAFAGRKGSGPFADLFADLIDRHRDAIEQSLMVHDRFRARLLSERSGWVITHGEPKINNTMLTAAGPVLIDWDTVRVGPPARDVWMLSPKEYQARTGRRVPQDQLDHYRLTWDLDDLCSYASWFVGDHERNADTELGWQGCQAIIDGLARRFG